MKNPIQMIKQCVEKEEPYFVLRGQDVCALAAIETYYEEVRNKGKDPYFIEEIEEIMKDFRAYRQEVSNTKIPVRFMADDSYKTIKQVAEGYYTEKRSRFISYAIPVRTVEEVKEQLDKYRKQDYDARHVCWAYMLGPERLTFRANDDGEPSSTAGKPILGQINSNGLTDILIVVIRYFGGIELGTSGLIVAYRTAAAEAIAAAEIEERTVDEDITIAFEYPYLNGIMRIVKEENPVIVSQKFEMDCEMTLRIRKGEAERLKARLLKVESVYIPRTEF